MNWRGRPLTSHEVIVNSIAATTTRTGLAVHAELDPGSYPAGQKISDAQMDALPLTRHDWHGDWNYTLRPEPPARPPAGQGTTARAHPALTGPDPGQRDQLISRIHAAAGDPPPIHLSLADQAHIGRVVLIAERAGHQQQSSERRCVGQHPRWKERDVHAWIDRPTA